MYSAYKWSRNAEKHVERLFNISKVFFDTLLSEQCPKDVYTRLSTLGTAEALRKRRQAALDELKKLSSDSWDFPMTYSHYYTDTIQKKQTDRTRETLELAIDQATTQMLNPGCNSHHMSTNMDATSTVAFLSAKVNPDLVHYSCEHILDCVLALYKVGNSKGDIIQSPV